MLLFKKPFHEGLLNGRITLTFRRWEKPHVRPGGRYRCHPIGVLEVDAIDLVRFGDITARDAKKAGFDSKAALLDYIRSGPGGALDDDTELYRVTLHHGGDGDRVEIALDDHLSEDDVSELCTKLERLDRNGAWTLATLRAIEKQPRVAASKLADKLGRDRAELKVDIRKLKKLGLTQSFEVGYEISPRGRAYLDAIAPRKRRRA